MTASRALLLAGTAIVAILAGAWSAQFFSKPTAPTLQHGTWLPQARALPAFELVDQQGRPFSRMQLHGHWTLVFFGFTHCPDVCPTTLTTLAQLQKQLIDLPVAQRPQVVFVSVDPQRDTPAQLQQYVHFFSPSFTGLTGSSAQLAQLTQALGVPVAIHENGNGNYSVDHGTTLFLLDPQARLAALFSAPHQSAALAQDLRAILS